MPRLPVVSSDADVWGNVLNSYLGVALNADGTLKPGAAVKLKAGAISDADFTTTPPDGALGVNTNAGALAFRNLGAWLQLLPSRAKAGVLLDADFGSGPVPAGALGVNTLLPALNFRAGSSWFQILPPKAKAGALTDADFGAAPPDGTIAVNTATNALAFRSSGSWFQLSSAVAPASPGTLYDYVERITNLVPTSTDGNNPDFLLTGNAVVYDGATSVWVEAYVPMVQISNATISYWADLWDGATRLGILGQYSGVTGTYSQNMGPFNARRRLTPSAGSHQYRVGVYNGSAGALWCCGTGAAGGYMPGVLRVVKA